MMCCIYITGTTIILAQIIARFEVWCACRAVQDYYSDNEEMLAKLAAGASGYGLIVLTGNAVESLIRQGALWPLNKNLLPNLYNIDPAYINATFDPGNRYSVPYAYTLTLIGYNREIIRELDLPTDSRAIIFEPKYIHPEISLNPAVFPSRAQQAQLEMLHDLNRHQRLILSRIWNQIKLK